MQVNISRKAFLRFVLILGTLLLIATVYLVGKQITLYTDEGNPVLFSPQVRATAMYRDHAKSWVARMQVIDADLVKLHTTQQDVYEQTRQADAILASALQTAQGIESTPAPSAMAGLHALLVDASGRYYVAAQLAAQWVGAPSPENRQAVSDALARARCSGGPI